MKQAGRQALCYGLADASQQETLKALLKPFDCKLVIINPQDTGRTIEDLAGLGQTKPGQAPVAGTPDERVLLLLGFPDHAIKALLAAIRQTQNLRIDLKAVVTENNRSWPFADLAAELKREHKLMGRFMWARHQFSRGQAALDEASLLAHEALADLETAVGKAKALLAQAHAFDDLDLDQLVDLAQTIKLLLDQA